MCALSILYNKPSSSSLYTNIIKYNIAHSIAILFVNKYTIFELLLPINKVRNHCSVFMKNYYYKLYELCYYLYCLEY